MREALLNPIARGWAALVLGTALWGHVAPRPSSLHRWALSRRE